MKIKYEFVTEEILEVDVDEVLGAVLIEMEKSERNSDRRETRRHSSFEYLSDKGYQFANDTDISEIVEINESFITIYKAIDELLPQQKQLLKKVFFKNISMAEIARQENVSAKAIQDRINKIKKRLKNIIEKY